jgi:hypothetical protein
MVSRRLSMARIVWPLAVVYDVWDGAPRIRTRKRHRVGESLF